MTGPLKLGLTGPIGCGKSTVLGWLAARGAVVIDADQVARDVAPAGSPVAAQIVAAFGPAVVAGDGSLDRAALGAIVFNDPDKLRRLEAITHPAVRERILETLRTADDGPHPLVVLEAIRLVEAGYPALLDEVWLVTCGTHDQRERLAARGLSDADASARIAAQAGLAERVRSVATRIIDTSGTLAETEAQVAGALAEALAVRAGVVERRAPVVRFKSPRCPARAHAIRGWAVGSAPRLRCDRLRRLRFRRAGCARRPDPRMPPPALQPRWPVAQARPDPRVAARWRDRRHRRLRRFDLA